MFASSLKQTAPILAVMFLAVLSCGQVECREIVDMTGRTVTVPDHIAKVYAASPPAVYMVYAIAPELLVGLNYPFKASERKYLHPSIESLPIIGGWFGQGRTPNLETLLEVKPDVMVAWLWKNTATNEKIEETAGRLGMPLVYVKLDSLGEYPEAISFIGKLLDREKRAQELSEYAVRTLAAVEPGVAAIPEDKKVSVYYAEAPDGLSTECDKSFHTELINLAGGKNVYQCDPKNDFGMERISIEQVMAYDPEVILAQEKEFAGQVYTDPKWQSIRAVKNRRVHLIPKEPFNWFDRPPSFMRLIGIKWLTNILYPDRFPFDSVLEIREFYSLFLGVQLDDGEQGKILQQ
ncbi:MAG: ABC transporter substrate-binding protein [Syntrophobacteraceae bacterium]